MDLHWEYVHSSDGQSIRVGVTEHDGRTLLECSDAGAFLRHLLEDPLLPELAPDTYVRGFVSPGEDALFELFDALGTRSRDPIRLDELRVRDRLSELW